MRSTVALVLALVAAPALAGCLDAGTDSPDVVATFYPLAFLAREIGGPDLRVDTLVPSGVEPHDWEPTPSDLARAGGAKLLLAQGAGFEPWLPALHENLGARAPRIVETTQGLPLERGGAHDHGDEAHAEDAHADEHAEDAHANETHASDHANEVHADDHANETHGDEAHAEEAHAEEAHAEEAHAEGEAHADGADDTHAAEGEAHGEESPYDPHTWLDPVLFARQADIVAAALAEAYPEQADGIRQRAEELKARLAELERDYEGTLDDCETRVIITTHDAFGYLARRYHLEVVPISGLSPDAEPDPAAVRRAVDEAREHNITIIFFEELVSPRVAQVVADEVGGSARVLSPLEGLDDEAQARGEDYVSLMRQNLVNLREAMRCA